MSDRQQVEPFSKSARTNVEESSGLVSVVMIFRDPPTPFFEEAVASVLAQTHVRIELLLCDDGSGLDSQALAKGLAAQHDRVRYVEHPRHEGRGMSATRNLGVRHARGQFVAFLDADDIWLPDHLEHELRLLERHPTAAAVCGQALTWRSWANPDYYDEPGRSSWPVGTLVPPPRMLEALLQRSETPTPTCSLTVRRDVWAEVGGSVEEFQGMYEDQALLAKLYSSRPVVIGRSDTALYRQHRDSSSAVEIRKGRYDPNLPNEARTRWLRWLRDYLGEAAPGGTALRLVERELAGTRTPTAATRMKKAAKQSVKIRLRSPAGRFARKSLTHGLRAAQRSLHRLNRPRPASTVFGFDRGLPIDRYYIERFLTRSAYLIGGAVLEVGDSDYTDRFGGDGVTHSDVVNLHPDPGTTIVADLEVQGSLPEGRFDCIIMTQTLHLLWDLHAVVQNVHDALRPGGVALVTVPFISQISTDRWADRWLWGIAPAAAGRLFGEVFGEAQVQVESFGNVRSAAAFLDGFAADELTPSKLDFHDNHYPMLVAVRAWRAP